MFVSHIPVSCGVQHELLLADCKLQSGVMNPLGNTDIIRFIKNLAGTITHSAHFWLKKKYVCALSFPLYLKTKYCNQSCIFFPIIKSRARQKTSSNFIEAEMFRTILNSSYNIPLWQKSCTNVLQQVHNKAEAVGPNRNRRVKPLWHPFPGLICIYWTFQYNQTALKIQVFMKLLGKQLC